MEKLMKPVEYAQELGISRQAVYAKIKRGILKSKNVEGKLYIVVDTADSKEVLKTKKEPKKNSISKKETNSEVNNSKDYASLLKAKDETIAVLKGTVKDLKKSNKQITKTLKGEIDLLKEAFHEMRTLYVHQLEQKRPQETIDVYTEEDNSHWIGLKKFFKKYNITKEKKQTKATKRFKKAYKNGDIRLMKIEGKLKLNEQEDYTDLLYDI
jgi:hypothetical protein